MHSIGESIRPDSDNIAELDENARWTLMENLLGLVR
jgi:hypothetical protein